MNVKVLMDLSRGLDPETVVLLQAEDSAGLDAE
jgi:hypothetical protein